MPWLPSSPSHASSPLVAPTIELGRSVGGAHPPFVVAAVEAGKLASLGDALAAVDAVALAACDAIKLAGLPWDWAPRVMSRAVDRGVRVIAPAADEDAIERLDWLGVDALEVFVDWADIALLTAAAHTGRPLLLAAAAAAALEVDQAVAIAHAEGAPGVALVQRVLGGGLAELEAHGARQAVLGVSVRADDPDVIAAAIASGARLVELRLGARVHVELLARLVRDADLAWDRGVAAPYRWATN